MASPPNQLTVDLLRINFAREIYTATRDATGTTSLDIGRARGQRRVDLVREWNRTRLYLSLRLEREPEQALWLRNARDGAYRFTRGRVIVPGAALTWQEIADLWPHPMTVQGVQQRAQRIMGKHAK